MIDWGDILETEDHKASLEKLYEVRTLEGIADYLGVSKNALRAKMTALGIPFKPKGGYAPPSNQGKSKLDSIPLDLFQTIAPRLLAKQFRMDISAVYKYMRRRGIKREVNTGEADNAEEAGLSSEGEVGGEDARVQSEDSNGDVQSGGESRTNGKA